MAASRDKSSMYTLPLPGLNQRWRENRTTYRPAGEVIKRSEYEVERIPTDAEAKSFCTLHHYLGASYPVAVERMGLYRRGSLVGVAIFSVPTNYDELNGVVLPPSGGQLAESFSRLGYTPKRALDLGRLVLLDEVPGNAESHFVSRCFDLLRARGTQAVIAFSDPTPRYTRMPDGSTELVRRGHCGSVYQSLSAVFAGRATARTLRVFEDYTVLRARTLQKIRKGEKGWRGAAALLQNHGADAPPEERVARIEWLNYWVARLTKPERHPGNFKYAFALDRRLRRFMVPSLPYPKLIDAPPNDVPLAA